MLIKTKVFPNSKKNEITQKGTDRLEVKIKAKAELGLANQAVLDVLAEYFKVPREKIRLIRGHKQRNKLIEVL